MASKLVWISVVLIVAASGFAFGTTRRIPYGPDNPRPPLADSEWEENLGNGVLGQLAYAVDRGRGMELVQKWGFEAEREIKVSSTADLGEFERYAPTGINKLGWSGTAFIQGSFEGNPYQSEFVPGILVYQLDNGPVVWIHATEAWLDRMEHSGDWKIQQEELGYSNVAEEIRIVILRNHSPGDDVMVHGIGLWGMQGSVGSVKLRLVYPFDMKSYNEISRYDIWLKRSRVKKLQAALAAQ